MGAISSLYFTKWLHDMTNVSFPRTLLQLLEERFYARVLASRGRFFAAGEPIPDDVKTPPCAERYRVREEQRDERISSETTVSDDETTERAIRDREDR